MPPSSCHCGCHLVSLHYSAPCTPLALFPFGPLKQTGPSEWQSHSLGRGAAHLPQVPSGSVSSPLVASSLPADSLAKFPLQRINCCNPTLLAFTAQHHRLSIKYLLYARLCSKCFHILLSKTRQRAQNGVTQAKPHTTKLRRNINTISALPEVES